MGAGRDDEALRAEAEHYRLIAESSRDMISLTDARGICTYASPASRDVLGFAPEELVGTSLFDLAHPDEATQSRELFERAVVSGQLTGKPYRSRMRHRDGSYKWLETTAVFVRDAAGAFLAMQAMGRDVSERVAAEEALVRSEENVRAMLEQLPNPVIVRRGRHAVYANQSFAELLGYRPEEIPGRDVVDCIDPADRPAIAVLLRAPRRLHKWSPEHRLIRADGGRVVVRVTGVPIVFEGVLSDLSIVEDLTARKALEAELAISDRMAALGRIAASVGHEINNPLAYVVGSLALIRADVTAIGEVATPLAQRLSVIEEGIDRIRSIVADLRNFSAIHEGALGAVDTALAVERALATATHETKLRAAVVRELGAARSVRAETSRLVQVLVNLIVNAAHAIPEGHADENEIRVVTRDESDGTVSIEVWDTGAGIPEGDYARLFDPFFTTKDEHVGTGLGLSIAHRIVTSFGGSIRAERRSERGSIFRVSLPAAKPDDAPEHDVASGEAREAVAPPRLRLLLVDDERAFANTMRMLLEPNEVIIEHSGRAAIARLATDAAFDVILCDLQMPHGSGAEVYQHARTTRPGLERSFVFMTGGVFTDEARSFVRDCAQPVVHKPFTSSDLDAAIASIAKLRP